ncbi:MAG TPA: hypothetical protein VFD90_21845 [Gaiellales bacterium]|jgi:hypothetical protein|nr:hypothetical protein [Gaiellales bacterium]
MLLMRTARRTALEEREPLLCAAIGAACALAVLVFAPPAQDLAAHVYRASLVSHGVFLWDNYWYTGTYPLVSYSLLTPVLSALLGVSVLVVVCTSVAGALFAAMATSEWGREARWPSRAFAAAAALPLLPGLDAYVVGVPLVLGTVVALQRGRRGIALACAALTLGASPLAFVFLLGGVGAILLAGRGGWRSLAVVGGGLGVLAGLEAAAMLLIFPGSGVYPFLVWHLVAVGALAIAGTLLAFRDRATRPIACFLCVWGLASVVSFSFANPVGDNVARLRYAVFPLLLLLAIHRRPRGFAVIVAAAAFVYAAAPDLIQVGGQADASSSRAAVWRPAVAYLERHLPVGARVEVVPTSARWESYYLPARGIPIARGWFRQTDLQRNALLYRKTLTRPAYEAWLDRTAVQFVLVTPFPLDDHGARTEARLLRSGRSGLPVIWRRAGFAIYAVDHPARLMIGGAGVRLTSFKHDEIAGTVRRGGFDVLRVAYSPYWTSGGAATCVVRGRAGMSIVRFAHAGHFSLAMTRDPITIVHRIADPDC